VQRVLEKMGLGCKAINTDGRLAAFKELHGPSQLSHNKFAIASIR
jgi:hypothetical protein